jgi:hypothetical protein
MFGIKRLSDRNNPCNSRDRLIVYSRRAES